MRAELHHTLISAIAVALLTAVLAIVGGCASHRSVRCNGKLEPINASARVPATSLGATESSQLSRSEAQ